MSSLLIFTLGPVQSFIAQARKLQDLYASSFILSHLCRVAISKAKEDFGAEIIYPDPNGRSLPNRLVALLPEKNKEELQAIGGQLEERVRAEWLTMGQEVLQKTGLEAWGSNGLKTAFGKQLASLLEIYWVAGPCEEESEGYVKRYKETECYLGAIKKARLFNPFFEQGRKCSLSGEQNALFYRGKRKAYLYPEAVEAPLSLLPYRYLEEGECLGGVALVKRCADRYFTKDYDAHFPSTAEIALMDSLKRLPEKKIKNYKDIFGRSFDARFFYAENLTEKALQKERVSLEKLDSARSALKELTKTAGEMKVRMTKYYAILCMDGDNMGKWVTGEFLAEPKETRFFQQKLTQELSGYAAQAKNIIYSPRGRLVYCGGDDILALLNINHLVEVLGELQQEFPAFEKLATPKDELHSTTSAGICIAHYKAPLGEVLKWARLMEEKAKNKDGKDAFALAVLKHSGEIHQTIFHWRYKDLNPLFTLEKVMTLLGQDKFSDTFIRKLRRELQPLALPEFWPKRKESKDFPLPGLLVKDFPASEEEIVEIEVSRLLERACQVPPKKREADFKKNLAELKKELSTLYIQEKLENLLTFLEIAAFLSREVNICA